jgi:hypothetical protein
LLTTLILLSMYLLGFCIAMDYQWQSTNGKKIDFVKIKFHSNEIVGWHCVYNLNSIQYNWIWIIIEFKFNEEKWDVKWCRRHWKYIGDYGVGKKTFENIFSILNHLGIG